MNKIDRAQHVWMLLRTANIGYTYQISSECAFFSIIFKFKNTDETSKILYVNCKRCVFFFSLSFNISRTSTFQAINIVVIRLLIFVFLFVFSTLKLIMRMRTTWNELKRMNEWNERQRITQYVAVGKINRTNYHRYRFRDYCNGNN